MGFRVLLIFALLHFIQWTTTAEIPSRKVRDSGSPVYDTIIVGLGTSGLSAYSKLARHGKHVLGLEAADRIGGRVHTINFGEGVVELGAEWIHGRKNSITYDLAVANNISLNDTGSLTKVYRSDKSELNKDLVEELISNCLEPPDATTLEQSQGEFYTKQCRKYLSEDRPELLKDEDFVKELLIFLDFYVTSNDASENWYEVTTKSSYVELDEFGTTTWHRHGYKTLFAIILDSYNNGPGLPQNAEMKLKNEVTKIEWTQDPHALIVVKCKDGSVYRANNVIVTVSLGVLKAKHSMIFSPNLPEKKIQAINNISMGLLDKVILSFEKMWWPEDVGLFGFMWKEKDKFKIREQDEWTTHVLGASPSAGSKNVLEVWFYGKTARYVETLPDDEIKNKLLGVLRLFMGSNVPEPKALIKSTWFTNPLTLGSYTFDNLQSPKNPTVRYDLAAPILDSAQNLRVMFAGEATNANHFGTVHGAAETGIREANRLLKDDKNSIY